MANEVLKIDANNKNVSGAITNDASQEIRNFRIDDTTKGLKVMVVGGLGTGTVTSVSVITANGISGSVATATTTPAITLTLGAITPSSVQVSGLTASQILSTDGSKNLTSLDTATYPSLTELSYVKGVTSAIQTQINAKGSGTVTAVSVATANGFSGSSSGGATPALTIVAGAIVPTSVNGLTISTTTGTFTLTNGKTFAVTNGLTLSGTDSTVMTFPTTSATIARTDAANTFTGIQTVTNMTFPDQGQLKLTVPTTDLKATGFTCGDFNCGYSSSAIGDLVYLDSSSTWQKCDANTLALYNGLLAIALEVKASANALLVALPGSFIYSTTGFPTWTIGSPIYMSETPGQMTNTQPTTTDAAIRIVGWGIHGDKMYFFPSPDYITHV